MYPFNLLKVYILYTLIFPRWYIFCLLKVYFLLLQNKQKVTSFAVALIFPRKRRSLLREKKNYWDI
jgi:hypothetical protein